MIYSVSPVNKIMMSTLLKSSKVFDERYILKKVSHIHVFVAASHQTRLDTRSKARRPIKVGIKGRGGRERAETRTLLVSAAHRLT